MAGNFSTRNFPPMAVGQRYGRLVAIAFADRDRNGAARWSFRCDCGKETVTQAVNVRRGRTSSCGCLHSETASAAGRAKKKHGMRRSREYITWHNMIQRCTNPKTESYPSYGGRGICVCDRWLHFENFYADMGPKPSPKHSIDRHPNNDGNYEPGNCRWALQPDQQRNKRSARWVTVNGRKMNLTDAAREAGIRLGTVWYRLKVGWPVERALKTPVR
jgi:hypothetical protein